MLFPFKIVLEVTIQDEKFWEQTQFPRYCLSACKNCTHFKVDALCHIPNIENTRGRTLKWKTRSPWYQYVITRSCGSPRTTRWSPIDLIWQIEATWQMQTIKNSQFMIFLLIPNVIAILLAVSWPLSHCIGTADLCMQPSVARTSAFHNNSDLEKCHNHIIRSWRLVLSNQFCRNWIYSRPNIGILMECGDNPLEKEQQFQELVLQNCAIAFRISITKNCYILYKMPYPCIDGTSIISCIVAYERAMSGLRRGVFLWQANTSTIDTMSCSVNFNTCTKEMDFGDILQYLSGWLSITAHLKKTDISHLGEDPSLQNSPCYKHLLKSS